MGCKCIIFDTKWKTRFFVSHRWKTNFRLWIRKWLIIASGYENCQEFTSKMSNTSIGVLTFNALVMVYLAFAFVLWELDPHEWGLKSRLGFVAMEVFIGILVSGALSYVDSGDDDYIVSGHNDKSKKEQ